MTEKDASYEGEWCAGMDTRIRASMCVYACVYMIYIQTRRVTSSHKTRIAMKRNEDYSPNCKFMWSDVAVCIHTKATRLNSTSFPVHAAFTALNHPFAVRTQRERNLRMHSHGRYEARQGESHLQKGRRVRGRVGLRSCSR